MGRARDLGSQHEWVLGIHDGSLRGATRELGGMRDVPLVELVVVGHEHRRRSAIGAARAPGLLPHRRERSGETVEHDCVEPAYVDAELERVRGRDAEQPAAGELELERAPFGCQVAGPVCRDS